MRSLLFLFTFTLIPLLLAAQNDVNRKDARGLKQGLWSAAWKNGVVKYKGSFQDDIPVGTWQRFHENGKLKAEMIYRGVSNRAWSRLFDADGKLYAAGVFDKMVRDSVWRFFNDRILISEESYKNGKREGVCRKYGENGNLIQESHWKNDLPDGLTIDYFPDGKTRKSELVYKQGKLDGFAVFYGSNGVKEVDGAYKNDLQEGPWNFYNEKGEKRYTLHFKEGKSENSAKMDSVQTKLLNDIEKNRGKFQEPAQMPF